MKSQKDIYADLWSFSSTKLPPLSNFAAQFPAASATLKLISVPSTQLCSTWDPLFGADSEENWHNTSFA